MAKPVMNQAFGLDLSSRIKNIRKSELPYYVRLMIFLPCVPSLIVVSSCWLIWEKMQGPRHYTDQGLSPGSPFRFCQTEAWGLQVCLDFRGRAVPHL